MLKSNSVTPLKHLIRGGQITLHNLRMMSQVINKLLLFSVLLFVLGMIITVFLGLTPYERYLLGQWLWAKVDHGLGLHTVISLRSPTGLRYPMTSHAFLHSSLMANFWHRASHVLWWGMGMTTFIMVGAWWLISRWLRRKGARQSEQQFKQGDALQPVAALRTQLIKEDQASDIVLGKEQLPLVKHSETQHLLMHGTTGSGKSSLIKEFLDHIRRRGDRAIIYDKGCTLTSEFYDDTQDVLLNPLDKRSLSWDLWGECRDKADMENVSHALIPMPLSTQDPFWINAARTIFAASAYRMKQQKNPSVLRLLKNLLTADIDQLQSLLSGTEAETLMSRKTEKTAISIKAVLATYLKCLSYLHDEGDSFSVRRWVEQTDNASWLFISSTGNKHASLRPMITAWLDIAINALLSLTVNPNRRIWLLLDELPSLQKMPYLKSGLAEARKFGGCFVIGIQSYADLEEIYGISGSRGLSSLLNTRFMFRVPDPELARWSSRNLGEMTYDITQEGISYGANTLRDGVSLSRQERTKPVVSVSDIQHLPNLQCYVRLPGQYPVTQLTLPWVAREAMSPPLIPRPLSAPDLRQDIHQLADDIIASASPIETMTQGKAQQDAAAMADIVLDI